MRKSYKYRIYPTKKQESILNSQLELCRKLYNFLLFERKESYEANKVSIAMYDQHRRITELKNTIQPELSRVHSQVLQDIAVRIDLAYKSFFRRVKSAKNGEKVGYPRFKGYGRYDSLTYKQYGNGVKILSQEQKGIITLSKIGHIKTIFHRKVEGMPKTAIIKRSSTGKWYIVFSCEIEKAESLPKSELNIGIDVGLKTFAYMSDNTKIENPRFFGLEEKSLAKAQRTLDKVSIKDKTGKTINVKSHTRIKAKKVVSRVHERIGFKRHDFIHQESKKLINKYQIICVEDL